MASGHFVVLVDTSGTRLSLVINEGQPIAYVPKVRVLVLAEDFLGGQGDIDSMKVWGDVDTSFDVLVQGSEGASEWMPFSPWLDVMLSVGNGDKTIHVKARDIAGNTAEATATVELLSGLKPIVSLVTTPHRPRYSTVSGFDSIDFSWRSDISFVEYVVKVVDSLFATYDEGVAVTGGTNLAGTGSWSGGQVVSSSCTTAQIQTASAGDGSKILKVFVKTAKGVWSD